MIFKKHFYTLQNIVIIYSVTSVTCFKRFQFGGKDVEKSDYN